MVQGFIASGAKTGCGIKISYDSYFEWLIHFVYLLISSLGLVKVELTGTGQGTSGIGNLAAPLSSSATR
jgi:hypothetical protein